MTAQLRLLPTTSLISRRLDPVPQSAVSRRARSRQRCVLSAADSSDDSPPLAGTRRTTIVRLPMLCLCGWLFLIAPLAAQESLRDVIDRELPPPVDNWPSADDAEFLRRVSLDLAGMPPSADDARSFLTDSSPTKREQLIDRLLASPQHARHLATALDVMLMERRGNSHVPQDEWMAWLIRSVRENKPWNVLVREMLLADGESPEQRAPARFILDRGTEPNAVARDVGRMFFGRDMQCAQCHDSPLVADFLQQDYQGLLAFTTTVVPVTKKVAEKDVTILAERSGSDLSFESVFVKGTTHRTGARVMGEPLIDEPRFLPGEEYAVTPADGVKSVPKFSRRAVLAEHMTNGTNRWFNENAVNRLWAMMLGRGLVHPLDMLHPDNPAVSPQLLRQLGERFAASNFDIRHLLREIALSKVYQRPFDPPADQLRQLSLTAAEQDAAAAESARLEATAVWERAFSAFQAAEAAMIPVAAELDQARTQYAEAKKKLDEATRAAADAATALDVRRSTVTSLDAAAASLANAMTMLGDDPAIRDISVSLSSRLEATRSQLPALESAAAEKSAAVSAPAEALPPLRATVEATEQKLKPLREAVQATDAATVAARQAASDATLVVTSLTDLQESALRPDEATNEIPEKLADRFALSQLKPLTPEQLCWSIFKVTTVYDRYHAGEVAELDKTAPLTPEQQQDAVATAARAVELEQRVYDKLKGYIATYANLYGGAAGQPQSDFYASADQALFAINGGEINSWTGPASGNAAERIVAATDPRVAAEELYLGILTRMPTEQEVQDVTTFLSQRPDRSKAAQELVWGLITSAEFRFNR